MTGGSFAKTSDRTPRKSWSVDFYTGSALHKVGVLGTHIPKLSPSHEIGMVYLALGIDMLARTNHHRLGGRHIRHRGFAGVGVGNPYRDWESVDAAAKGGGDCA